MKATNMANKPQRNPSSESRGTLTGSGLDLETKIFSPSGRGGAFFLTSLFIERIDEDLKAGCRIVAYTAKCRNQAEKALPLLEREM
jgi:hypothetical protein